MCGIVGAVSNTNNIIQDLINGLKRLEYRGYDSCGIAYLDQGELRRVRSTGRIIDLHQQAQDLKSTIGIAHTRWATHGKPDTENAHPHFSHGQLSVVHNGIIENHEVLRQELINKGYVFESQTDTEVIVHLIHSHYHQHKSRTIESLRSAIEKTVHQLQGAYAIAILCKDHPNHLWGAREGSPLIVGIGHEQHYLASDAMAVAGLIHEAIYLEDGDVVELTPSECHIWDHNSTRIERKSQKVQQTLISVELGTYSHYMQKEIFEQPKAISDTLEGIESFEPTLFGENAADIFAQSQRILILACGTSYYSGLTARYWLEDIANLPTQVEIASEFRYRKPAIENNTLVIVISQSGETADTLAALKYAKEQGVKHSLAICNNASSAMVRETDCAFITRAGPEIGVASTKAFTTQLVALFTLTITLAILRRQLSQDDAKDHLTALRHLPNALNQVLALEPQIIAWAQRFANKENALFLGRGIHYPIALEGALKLKEITYIHAESYPAGELKHGPLALVTEAMPIITVAPNDALIEKLDSNIQEVKARGGQLYIFADKGISLETSTQTNVIHLPENYGHLSPVLHVVPLQLLAYHTACMRGTDVDKPRNLAKSVTVE